MNDPCVAIARHSGPELVDLVPDLAALRIAVFREFPYLYDGDAAYESRYLRTYSEAPGSVIVIARSGGRIVGAATGVPLQGETAEVRAPFLAAGIAMDEIFYCGESVLLPDFRGRGIGVAFFAEREAHAAQLGLRQVCFCAVERPEWHTRRPPGYVPLDGFWRRRGYRPAPALHTVFHWKDLDEAVASAKSMRFWIKSL